MGHLRIYFGICFHRIFVRHKSNSRPIVSVGDSPTGAQIFIYTTPYRTLASHVHYRTVVSRLHAPTRAVEILSVVWVPSPHSVESLAYWVTCVGDARVYHLLSVLLAETISADMECSVVHGRLLAVLFNVRSTMEQSSLWSRLLWVGTTYLAYRNSPFSRYALAAFGMLAFPLGVPALFDAYRRHTR
jgi:hypothetical protein